MALESLKVEERVDYLIEAAALSEQLNNRKRVIDLFRQALIEADKDVPLNAKVRLLFARHHLKHQQFQEILDLLKPLHQAKGLSASERARIVLLTEEASTPLEISVQDELRTLYDNLEAENMAELQMAIADIRIDQGDALQALTDLAKAESLDIPNPTRFRLMETLARAQDRTNQTKAALSKKAGRSQCSARNGPQPRIRISAGRYTYTVPVITRCAAVRSFHKTTTT